VAGEKVFRKCKGLSHVDKGGANRVGPNLYGIGPMHCRVVDGLSLIRMRLNGVMAALDTRSLASSLPTRARRFPARR